MQQSIGKDLDCTHLIGETHLFIDELDEVQQQYPALHELITNIINDDIDIVVVVEYDSYLPMVIEYGIIVLSYLHSVIDCYDNTMQFDMSDVTYSTWYPSGWHMFHLPLYDTQDQQTYHFFHFTPTFNVMYHLQATA